MAGKDSLGLGLIACGSFGEFCMEIFSAMDGLHVAAVADVRPDAAGTV